MDPLLEEAIAEAYASAPQDVHILHTVEIHHRTFTAPVRLVRHPLEGPKPREFRMRLEDAARYNPGQVVTFLGVPFELVRPEKSGDTPGEFTFKVARINDLLDEELENAALEGGVIEAVYREYREGDELQGPASYWPGIHMRSPTVDPKSGDLVVTGTVLDWLNRKYGRLYTPGAYPGLVG